MTAEEYASVFFELPEPEAKPLWVQDFHNMIVHTREGHAGELISKRRPNEEETTRDYRIENDRAITLDAFNSAITNLQRTLSHSSVEMRYPERVRQYLDEKNFRSSDFLSFFQRFVVKQMIEAANALLVWWPVNVGIPNQRVRPVPIIVMPDQIHHYTEEVLTWLTNEKTESGGRVWRTILADGLYITREIITENKVRVEVEQYYSNPMGDIYALVLGGDETSKRTEGNYKTPPKEIHFFTSFMHSALPFADECRVQFSDHQGVMVNCAFPLREVEPMDCPNPECSEGYYRHLDDHGNRKMCGSCNGTGRLPMNSSPYGWLIRPKRKKGVNDTDTSDIPMIRFLHPDSSILEFGSKSWRELLKDTQDALNLLFVDEAQSGIAKNIDREDKLAWLDKVAVHFYKYLIASSVTIIHKFLYPGEEAQETVINLPSTFVVKSESEMIDDIAKLRTQGVPDFVMLETMREFVSKKFGGDPIRMKMFDVLVYLDPLATKTYQEKANYVGTGAVSDQSLQFSVLAPGILSNYARTTENFMDLSIEQIANELRPIINQMIETESFIRGES